MSFIQPTHAFDILKGGHNAYQTVVERHFGLCCGSLVVEFAMFGCAELSGNCTKFCAVDAEEEF
jgi:hypothetical protein